MLFALTRPSRRQQSVIVPPGLVSNSVNKKGALFVFIGIQCYYFSELAKTEGPSVELLSTELHMATRDVKHCIACLEKWGYLTRVPMPGRPTNYKLHYKPGAQ